MRPRFFGTPAIILVHPLQVLIRHLFRHSQFVLRPMDRQDQLGELDLQRQRVPVLRILDEEHHEKRNDGGRGVDHQLLGVAVMKEWPCCRPNNHGGGSEKKSNGLAGHVRDRACEPGEPLMVLRAVLRGFLVV